MPLEKKFSIFVFIVLVFLFHYESKKGEICNSLDAFKLKKYLFLCLLCLVGNSFLQLAHEGK